MRVLPEFPEIKSTLVQPLKFTKISKNTKSCLNKPPLIFLLIQGLSLTVPYVLPRNLERGTCIIIGITAGIIIVHVINGRKFRMRMLTLLVSPIILTAMIEESVIYTQLAGYDHASLVIAIIGSVTRVVSLLAAVVLANPPTSVLLLNGTKKKEPSGQHTL